VIFAHCFGHNLFADIFFVLFQFHWILNFKEFKMGIRIVGFGLFCYFLQFLEVEANLLKICKENPTGLILLILAYIF